MSTAAPEPVNPSLAPAARSGRWKTVAAWLLIVPVLIFIAIEVPTLLAERAIEMKRREIGRAGGKCEIRRSSPAWLQQIAGKEFHSFLDRSTIDGVVFSGEKINDAALSSLAGLTDVRFLVLEDTRITEKSLEVVSQLKTLQVLNIRNTPLQDLSRLEELPALESLMVDFSKVRNERFSSLARIPRLRLLSAASTQMSDAGLAALSKSSSLEELNISYANLGEHGLAPLQAMSNLKVLVLQKSVFNPTDLEEFKEKNPGCKVVL